MQDISKAVKLIYFQRISFFSNFKENSVKDDDAHISFCCKTSSVEIEVLQKTALRSFWPQIFIEESQVSLRKIWQNVKTRSSKDECSTGSNNHLRSTDLFRS